MHSKLFYIIERLIGLFQSHEQHFGRATAQQGSGAPGRAPQASRGVGMMTAAFAVGQIAGPLTVSLFAGSSSAFTAASIIAALALVVGNFVISTNNTRCLP